EAGNLFKVFNAPERFRSAAGAKGFNAIASRNITILLGIIEYLAQNDWKLTAAVISDVLSKKPMEQISDEVVEELIRRVVDTDARELLYRLKLVIHDFTDDTVVKIASIAPAIQDPLTKIHSLKGRWIETVSTGRYNLAPLFKQLPKTMLRSDITKRVYHTLGMMLLEIGTLGPNEVNQSIMYFIGAEEYLIVSDILMKAYMSLSFQEETTDQLLFIKLWKHTSLPKQIPLPRRVIIRTYQLVHTRKDDADFDTILKSIMEMRESLGNDFHSTLAFIMSASIQSLFLGIENIDYAFKLIRQWSIRWDNLSPSEKQLLGSIDQLGPAIIPWSSLFHIKNLDDVSRWLIQVEQLPTVIQQEIISHNMSFVGTKYIIDKCWPHPDDGELDSQQWKSLAISLEDLANRASEIGFNLFWAWAIRSVIIIECEQLGKFDEGIQRGLKLIELEHDSSVIKFIILDIVGKEYYHEQKYDQAIPRLLQCLEEDGSNYPDVQILTYINLSIAYSTSDDIERLTAVDNSIEFKSLVDEIDYLSIVKAYGTKAIAQWQIYGVAHALEPLSQLSEILWVHANRSSPLWKDLFILTGHVAGFFLALARTGKGPDTTKNGDPYLTPSAGHFTTYHTERHTLFKPEEEIMLYLQLFGLAREFCNTIEMSKWYGVAKKFIEQNPLNFCAKSSYMISCGYLELSDDRYDYFIKYGLDAGIHTTVQRYCINKELPTPYYESDLTAILDSENEWAAADEYSFHLIIAPIVFALAIESIQQNDKFDLHMTQVIMEISRHMEKGYAIPRWEQAITAFHIIQDKSVGSNKLIDFGNKMQSEKLASVALIAYIGSTLKLDSNVEQYAIAFHSLSQWQTFIPSSIWSELVVPFHFYFWLHIIDKAGFAFRSPIILRKGIEQISLRDENATRKLMELIFDGLDIQIPVN
ncbi:MAG: hypothetical protein H8E14_04135, partial [Candidatus Marinimicrobia bacterium]|nr:hypothetical protein [Candidatus Neomarinimicrobiota bacterium]